MEDLNTYILEELSIGKGCYGIPAPAIPFNPSKYTYLRITDINDDGSLNKENLMSVDAKNIDNYILRKNDIVFARTGNSTGRSYFYDGSDGKLVYAGFLVKFSIDEEKVNPRILKYYTHSKRYFDWIHSFDTGGTRGNINAKTYGKMPITLPPRWIQNKIVNILKSLDDKIELNNKINRNLEAQAQAIFKSWFIDFEPFKNGRFIDSELGKIPEGWKVYRLSELCEIITKGTTPTTLKKSFKNKGINFIKAETVSNNHLIDKTKLAFIDIQTHKLLSRSQLKPFDILFTIAGTIGRFAIVPPDIIPANTNQAIAIIRCKDIYMFLVYSMFLCGNHLTYFNSKVVQAVQANLSLSTIGSLPMILPPKAVVERYISIVYPLFKLTFDNSGESSHLAQLRNTLLPKLMTGKINISDIVV